jgi:hypothetical protein
MAVWITIQCHNSQSDVEIEQEDHWSSPSRLNQWQLEVVSIK